MHQLLNTLYVTTENSYLRLGSRDLEGKRREGNQASGAAASSWRRGLLRRRDGQSGADAALRRRWPVAGVARPQRTLQSRLEGPVSGNVLLRRAQHEASINAKSPSAIAKKIVAGKIQNSQASISCAPHGRPRIREMSRL